MKLSKFNYFTKNEKNELLLFNTLEGTKSLLKIPAYYAESVEGVLSGKSLPNTLDNTILEKLVRLNYIISNDVDEEAIVYQLYLKNVCDSALELTIIPTEKCNFRCKYCYESFPDNIMSKEIQNAIVKYIKKNIHKYSSLHVSWFGGEPLLAIDIIESLSEEFKKVCAYYKKPYTASITTNGYMLNVVNFKRLLKCNVLYYQVTVDGLRDTHDSQRPHVDLKVSTYDQIINNFLSIKQHIRSNVFRITVRSNFSKPMIHRIAEYKETFYSLFKDDKRFQFFIRPVMDWGGETIESFRSNLIESKYMDELYSEIISNNNELPFIYGDFMSPGCGACEAGKMNYYIITTDGNIYKCTCDFAKYPEAKIGELDTNGNMILNNTKASQWLCNFKTCTNDCFYSPICFKDACPSRRIFDNKTTDRCPIEKRNLSQILCILDKDSNLFQSLL